MTILNESMLTSLTEKDKHYSEYGEGEHGYDAYFNDCMQARRGKGKVVGYLLGGVVGVAGGHMFDKGKCNKYAICRVSGRPIDDCAMISNMSDNARFKLMLK